MTQLQGELALIFQLWTCSVTLTLQAELKKEVAPMKKHLRCLYEAKQECDDTTVHIKVSTKTGAGENQ